MELTFILTEDCNLRCRYCYQPEFRRTRMSSDIACRAIESAIEHGADSLALTFFGGEPLLESDTLFEVLRFARAIEKQTGVFITAKVPTNGLLLDEPIIRQARSSRLFVSLSFDGIREAQDSGRLTADGESSFDQAEAALRRLVAAKIPFGVYSVITPANVRWMARSRRYLFDAGARIVVSALDYTADWDERAVRTLRQQYREVGRFYRKLLKRQEDFHLEPFDSRIAQWTRMSEWRGCSPGVSAITVGPDGSLYGCVEYFYRRLNSIGHVDRWIDWDAVQTLSQERSGQPAECLSCGVRDRCNSTCACVNLRTTGSVNVPPESVCQTEQTTIQTVDELAASLFKDNVPGFLTKHYSHSYHMLAGIERVFESMELDDERCESESCSV